MRKQNSFFYLFSILFFGVFSSTSFSCSVDTPSTAYNAQKIKLKSPQTSYFFYSQWLNTVLSDYYKLPASQLDESFVQKNSPFYQDILFFFNLWQKYNLDKDPHFLKKQQNIWLSRGSQKDNARLRSLRFDFGQTATFEDLDVIWQADSTTQIRNLLKEFLLISKYFSTPPSKTNQNFQLLQPSLKQYLDFDSPDLNLIKYTLDNNPILEWAFSSSNLVDRISSNFYKVHDISTFNSLFSFPSSLSAKTDVLGVLDTLAFKEDILGFQGVKFLKNVQSGDTANNLDFFVRNRKPLIGFVVEAANFILNLTDMTSTFFADKPLLSVEAITSTTKLESLTVSDFVFKNNHSNTFSDTKQKLNYEIVSVIPNDVNEVIVSVKVSNSSDPTSFVFYTVTFDSQLQPSFIPKTFGVLPSYIVPQIITQDNTPQVLLRFVARVVPLLVPSLTHKGNFFSFANTPFADKQIKDKLAFYFLQADASLLNTAKAFFLREGFMVESSHPLIQEILGQLGLVL